MNILIDLQIYAHKFIGYIFRSGTAGIKGGTFKMLMHTAKLITRMIVLQLMVRVPIFPLQASTAF